MSEGLWYRNKQFTWRWRAFYCQGEMEICLNQQHKYTDLFWKSCITPSVHSPTEEIREATSTPAPQVMDVQVYACLQVGITTKSWGPFRGAEELAQELEPFHETAGRKGRGFLPWSVWIYTCISQAWWQGKCSPDCDISERLKNENSVWISGCLINCVINARTWILEILSI